MLDMNFEYRKLDPNHQDFRALVTELNDSLSQITRDSGESSFSSEAFDSDVDGCVVAYLDAKPVACGVFRYHVEQVCELKRMYSKLPGAGAYLLKLLEAYSVEKGYRKAILSTRRINVKAVRFYERNGYAESEAFGKYIGVVQSVCMSKVLATSSS